MSAAVAPGARSFVARWIGGLALAEAVGIGYGAALGALLAPRLADPATSRAGILLAVLSIGVVEGSALGWAQASGLRRRLPRLRRSEWLIPTVLFAATGWGLGMMGTVLGGTVLGDTEPPAAEPSTLVQLLAAGAMGTVEGALLGAAQWLVLRRHARSAGRWVVAQALGWTLAMPAIFAGFVLPPDDASTLARIAAAVAGGALAGLCLGVVTAPLALAIAPWVSERPVLAGRWALVTGASSGIGAEVAAGLCRLGAKVTLLGRSEAALTAQRAAILAERPDAQVDVELLDLSSHRSIDALAGRLSARGRVIDVVVHDAGTVANERTLTEDGEELQLAVDALGPIRLTAALGRVLAPDARIVVLDGIYQRRGVIVWDDLHFRARPYDMASANAQAQRMRMVWTAALAERWPSRTVVAVHPGAVRTRAITSAPAWARVLAASVARPAFVRAELGALPVLHAVIETVPSGRFYDRFTLTEDQPRPDERSAMAALLEREGITSPRAA